MTGSVIKREVCGGCRYAPGLHTILDMGAIPLAGEFPLIDELDNVEAYPFKLLYCNICKLVQSDSIIPPARLFEEYRYMSGVGLESHFKELALYIDARTSFRNLSLLEIGSNDGTLLDTLRDNTSLQAEGIDPSKNISKIAISKGHKVTVDFFNDATAKRFYKEEQFSFIVACNCFAHMENLFSMISGIRHALELGGLLILEVHNSKKIVEQNQYDFIYHEHIYYWTPASIENFLLDNHFDVISIDDISSHSGSMRIVAEKVSDNENTTVRLMKNRYLRPPSFEENLGYYKHLQSKMTAHSRKLNGAICALRGKTIGFGASGRANILCNIAHLSNKELSYIVDESPEKQGRFIPFMDIPIHSFEHLKADPDVKNVVILAWNYADSIREKLGPNYNYLIPLPYIRTYKKNVPD